MERPSLLFPHEELERLAQDCASSDTKTTETDVTQFKSLQSEAKRLAKTVMNTGRIQHRVHGMRFCRFSTTCKISFLNGVRTTKRPKQVCQIGNRGGTLSAT